ncbi:hypothetical protein [Sinorhizobium americanum]|uniref:Uncharacterized protein n=1 Tax=Sinorhizobium americanum TaxID=194963 RepID=A0A1L3LSU0_9HYPH|nr:hypothetical protein [Sinorhizobium americanum]APG93147.1 hypothetical protein SAMCFNEI73_pA0172 [Sinorhizobium americanum]
MSLPFPSKLADNLALKRNMAPTIRDVPFRRCQVFLNEGKVIHDRI